VTRLPVWSLYGARREPTDAMLRGIDTVVVDLQDVGSRYYTFIWTMALVMRACARSGVHVVVLDRPNPLGGAMVEGTCGSDFASFVGLYPLAIRHGLTIERSRATSTSGTVSAAGSPSSRCAGGGAACCGKTRACRGAALAQHADARHRARVSRRLSHRRNQLVGGSRTTRPFEWIGAPYLDAHRYAAALERERLPACASGRRASSRRFTSGRAGSATAYRST